MQLLRRPAVPFIAVVVLALGLGGTVTVFSALYSALLKPLPYRAPERLAVIHEELPGVGMKAMSVSVPVWNELRRRGDVFEDVAAYYFNDFTMTGSGYAQHVDVVNASPSLFSVLGVPPLLGHTYTAETGKEIVLSEKLWRESFGADSNVVGRRVTLDGKPYEVVGVMPAAFQYPYPATQAWVPLEVKPLPFTAEGWQGHWLRVLARVRSEAPGPAIDRITDELARQYPAALKSEYRWSISSTPLRQETSGRVRNWLLLAFGAVLALLVAACANVSGLLLVRAVGRRREMAIRSALGATRMRIMRGVLGETLVLATAGCCLGTVLAVWGVSALNRWSPLSDVSLHPAVLAAALAVATVSGLLTGLLPAFWSGRPSASPASIGRSALSAAQIAVAVVLVSTALLLTRSFLDLQRTSPGFDAANVFCGTVQLSDRTPEQRMAAAALFEQLQAGVAALPNVERASGALWLPFSSGNNYTALRVVERPLLKPDPTALSNTVLPGYFETLRIPLLAGRYFERADSATSEPVAIVDQEFARQFLNGADPLGFHLITEGKNGKPRRIVGVVGSVKTSELGAPASAFVYAPYAQAPSSALMLAVRSKADVTNDVRRVLAGLRPDVALFETGTMESRLAKSLEIRLFIAALLNGFALLGLLLAALGLYGVLAYSVEQRRKEFAIRTALGARPAHLFRTIGTSGLIVAGLGLGTGVLLSAGAGRWIGSLLLEAAPFTLQTMLPAVALLAAVAGLASWIPLRRAGKANPADLLRE
jgi:putative ABC transport system permease protein